MLWCNFTDRQHRWRLSFYFTTFHSYFIYFSFVFHFAYRQHRWRITAATATPRETPDRYSAAPEIEANMLERHSLLL